MFSRGEYQAPPEVQCYGKVRYLSRAHARRSIREHRDRKGLAVYPCPHCTDPDAKNATIFHIGNRPQGPR